MTEDLTSRRKEIAYVHKLGIRGGVLWFYLCQTRHLGGTWNLVAGGGLHLQYIGGSVGKQMDAWIELDPEMGQPYLLLMNEGCRQTF